MDFTVKIGGEAGFGIMTSAVLVGKLATRSGYFAFGYSEYPSLIRGGHNVIEVRISDSEVYSQERGIDVLVCLNEDTLALHQNNLKPRSVVILDKDKVDLSKYSLGKGIKIVDIPFARIIREEGLSAVMMNNIALGALVGVIEADLDIFNGLIKDNFAKKAEEIIVANQKAARIGYDRARNQKADFPYKLTAKETDRKMYILGNEMIALGVLNAGCKFYCAYPMTPSSGVLHYLAGVGEKAGLVVKHAEDEISVINMALGASWAGVRSMLGTSGGGFALMVESVALAGITEIPLVIMMGMRPGPATGMPTWTEQGDLLFITFSGHGEFPKIVLAPGDLYEAYELTSKAFDLADIYQTPVFIMADKYLLESQHTLDESKVLSFKALKKRGKLLTEEDLRKIGDYKRYLDTPDGISPRALPGMKNALHQANSYEHLEDGHTTESAEERIKQVNKRNRKMATYLKQDFKLPVLFGKENAPITVVSWGSCKGPILEAMKVLGDEFNYIHFNHIWPLDREKVKQMFKNRQKLLLIENNSQGQFGMLLKMSSGVEFEDSLLKYDGRPIYPEEIVDKIKKLKR